MRADLDVNLQGNKAHRQRPNDLHQVSADLAKRYSLISIEKLNTKNMTWLAKGTAAAAGLNEAMLDVSPARLIELLTFKAERAVGYCDGRSS